MSNIYGSPIVTDNNIIQNTPTINVTDIANINTNSIPNSKSNTATVATGSSVALDSDGFQIPSHLMMQEMDAEKSITPPLDYFYRDKREKNGGCCGPNCGVNAILFITTRYRNKWIHSATIISNISEFRKFTSNLIETGALIESANVDLSFNNISSNLSDTLQNDYEQSLKKMFLDYEKQGIRNNENYRERMLRAVKLTEEQCESKSDSMWYEDVIICLVIRAALQNDLIPGFNADPLFSSNIDLDRYPDIKTLHDKYKYNECRSLFNIIGFSILYISEQYLKDNDIQEYCKYYEVIIVNSKNKHFITYFRKNPTQPNEVDHWENNLTNNEDIWLDFLFRTRHLIL